MPTLPEPKGGGEDWERPSDGLHLAILYMIVELGSHQENYQGKPKSGLTPQMLFRWEMCDEDCEKADEHGVVMPKTIGKRYTWSMSEKAKLRHDLENWRGVKFEQADFGPQGFNVTKLLGLPCMVQITSEQKGDKTYTDVTAITRIYKGLTVPPLKHKKVLVALNPAEWDGNAFDSLSDNMKNKIKKSPEYQALMRGSQGNAYREQSGGGYDGGRYKTNDPGLNDAARRQRETSGDFGGRYPAGDNDFPGDQPGGIDDELNDEIPF